MVERALAIEEKSGGPPSEALAVALRAQAFVLVQSGKYEQAEQKARRALEIDEKAAANDVLEVSASLDMLGQILFESGKLVEAEPLIRRELKIDETVLGTGKLGHRVGSQ